VSTSHHHWSSFRLFTPLAWHASCNFCCSESKAAELAAAEAAGESDKVQQLQATVGALSSEQVRRQELVCRSFTSLVTPCSTMNDGVSKGQTESREKQGGREYGRGCLFWGVLPMRLQIDQEGSWHVE
jgi:hypothetical protein